MMSLSRTATLLATIPLIAACDLESASLEDGGTDEADAGTEAGGGTDGDGDGSSGGTYGTGGGPGPATGTGAEEGNAEEGTGGDPSAQLVWSKEIDGVLATHMALTSDGSIVVVGSGGYLGGADFEHTDGLWLAKFAADGSPQWTTAVPWTGESNLNARDIEPLADGGFVLVIDDSENGGADGITRYDSSGQPVWFAPVENGPQAVDIGSDGTMVVGGQLVDEDTQTSLGIAVAVAADGTIGWSRTYGGADEWTSIADLRLGPDGDVYLLARTAPDRVCLHRADGTGALKWDRVLDLDAGDFDHTNAMQVGPDGTVIALVGVAGGSQSLVALDGDGNELWTATPSVENGTDLALGADGSFVITDGTNAGSPTQHVRVARHEPGGAIRWQDTDSYCRFGSAVELTADDDTLVLAQCSSGSALLLYTAP